MKAENVIMYAVFSVWFIVLAVMVVAIAGLIFAFVKMDKKDRVLINEFVQSNQAESVDQNMEENSTENNNE